jgi:GNAT superfamily N-acetyltransferase
MQDALRQFLSTEIETTASGWFKLAETLSKELHHLAEYTSLERHLADGGDAAAMQRRADGRAWLHAWEWVFYTLSLDSESIDSYNAFDLPWQPILIRARQLLQAHLGAEEQRNSLLAMAEFLGPTASERLTNLLGVEFDIPPEHQGNPSSELIIDNLQKALRAEQPELSIEVHDYDPCHTSVAKKGMTAILRELKTMYGEEGFADAVKRLDHDIVKLCDLYGGIVGKILLARAIDEPDGFIGGVCLTGLTKESCEIRYLWVEPEYRTRKVGKRIIDSAIKAASAAECKSVYVEIIQQKLKTAYSLFTEMNFEASSREPNQVGRTVLERQLD